MNSHLFKFSKIKKLMDYEEKSELNKPPDLDEAMNKLLKNMIQNQAESTLLFICNAFKDYFLKVKLKQEISTASQQASTISYKLSKLNQKLQKRKYEKQDSDTKKALRSSLLQLYQENLSMKILSTKENILMSKGEESVTFVFHNIDEKDPKKVYSFILITNGWIYKVANCQPSIPDMKDLLSSLNKTNDLRTFIIKVRKCFVDMASK